MWHDKLVRLGLGRARRGIKGDVDDDAEKMLLPIILVYDSYPRSTTTLCYETLLILGVVCKVKTACSISIFFWEDTKSCKSGIYLLPGNQFSEMIW